MYLATYEKLQEREREGEGRGVHVERMGKGEEEGDNDILCRDTYRYIVILY